MQLSIHQRLANITLFALVLSYIIMLGGGTYEHLNVTPVITSAPPKSLSMLQGPYGFTPVKFWGTFRPITILFFILSLIFNWRISRTRRKLLIISFIVDIAVTISTFTYFAPEAGVIARAPFNSTLIDSALLERAQLWKHLNLIRLMAFYLTSVMLLFTLNTNVVEKSR
jgi:hypothetical protein